MTDTQLLPRSTPEAQGVSSSSISAFVEAVEAEKLELHSFILVRHGSVIAEGWWPPYAAHHPHMLYSLSKSFTSTAAGLAISEGLFTLDDTVVSLFSDDVPAEISPNLAAMRVRDLLSMSSGHSEDPTGKLGECTDGNWARLFLSLPIEHAPGSYFVYNSLATYMVAVLVEQKTGKKLLDYLRPRLFAPLGFGEVTWEVCPRGYSVGGWGLSIRTEEIAKFGQLYLQQGVWHGDQILSKEWVAEATRKHISNGTNPENDWSQGYGFQFWRCRHGAYRGDGAFGQYCVVMPDQDAVLAITSNVDNMQSVLNHVWTHLLPGMENTPLPLNDAAEDLLDTNLMALQLKGVQGNADSPVSSEVSGKTYRFAENEWKAEWARLDFEAGNVVFTAHDQFGEHRFVIGLRDWEVSDTTFLQGHVWHHPPKPLWRVAAIGAWTAEKTFTARLCFYETPFTPTLTFAFEASQLMLTVQGRLGFGPSEHPPLQGEGVTV